jgi:hypothetical protein
MVYAVDPYNPSIADFNIYDKLFLQGFASVLHLLLPEPADVDKGQLIGRAKMWGMWTPIFQHKTDESGLQLVVAESAAGMRWMRAD